MWINQAQQTVGDNEPYTAPDGTNYPGNYPKGEIFGLSRLPDPDPIVLVPPPITVVTMRQARLALLGAGLLATVNSAIAAMPGTAGEAARITWEFSSEVKRNQPLVSALGGVLGLTTAQLDALFVTASNIP